MEVKVTKLTDEKLLQRANSFTTGRESHMTLSRAYVHGHSPIRTQLFWIECTGIPLFVASQLVRSHVGVQFFQRSKRTDRGGADFRSRCFGISLGIRGDILSKEASRADDWAIERIKWANEVDELPKEFDRYAPTDIAFLINAEALINMAHKRLCAKASSETRDLMMRIVEEVSREDPSLGEHLVPQCVFRGGICTEPKSCGWIKSDDGKYELSEYLICIK